MIFPAGQSYLNFEGMIELGLKRGENETEERDLQALETIAVRSHWGIENRLHWRRNVTLREDESRVRQGHADENLAVLRHISLNLLCQEQSSRVGIHTKQLKAGWDNTYLQGVLATMNEMRLPRARKTYLHRLHHL